MFLIYLFLLLTTPIAALDYYEEGVRLAEGLKQNASSSNKEKELLKQQIAIVKLRSQEKQETADLGNINKKCLISSSGTTDVKTSLYVFVSFSLPEETWLSLSRGVEKVGGVLVLRGLPDNSFKRLAGKIHALRQKGVLAPITIDPKLFSKFDVKTIPCFVATEKNDFDKLTGNVSLKFALGKMNNHTAETMRKLL